MKSCVTTFRIRTGTGAQTVTGIVDQDGNPFTPTFLMFFNGTTELNVLWSNPTGLFNTGSFDRSFYRVSDAASGYRGTAEFPRTGFGAGKFTSTANGTGAASAICNLEADVFFGGTVYRIGAMVDVRSGEFDLNWTTNLDFFTVDVVVCAFGGDDLEFEWILNAGLAGAHATSFEAKGLLMPTFQGFSASDALATGVGAADASFGWDSPNGGPSASTAKIVSVDSNARYQRTNSSYVAIDGSSTYTGVGEISISTWSPTEVVAAGPSGAALGGLIVGGDGILTASGSFTPPLATGTQTIDLGIHARWIMFMTNGLPASTAVDSGTHSMMYGWASEIAQAGYYWAESAGALPPLNGASYLSNARVIQLASAGPQAASTVFDGLATLVALNEDGTLELDWTAVNGETPEILWFAIGIEAGPPTPPPPLNPYEFPACVPGAALQPVAGQGDGVTPAFTWPACDS